MYRKMENLYILVPTCIGKTFFYTRRDKCKSFSCALYTVPNPAKQKSKLHRIYKNIVNYQQSNSITNWPTKRPTRQTNRNRCIGFKIQLVPPYLPTNLERNFDESHTFGYFSIAL